LSTHHPNTQLEDHPLLAVCDCLFTIFTATLHIGGCSSFRNLRTHHAMVTGTHLIQLRIAYVSCFILVFHVLLHCATSAFVCACVHICVCVCVRACVRACERYCLCWLFTCVAAILSAFVLTPFHCLVETSNLNGRDCCSHW